MDKKESDELHKALRKIKDTRIITRLHAVIMVLSKGVDVETTAYYLSHDPNWVRRWVQRYEKEGLDGLSDRPRIGRPSKVDHTQVDKIIFNMCSVGARPIDVQKELRKKLSTSYSLSYIRKRMKKNGYSRKKPTRFHVNKASIDEQNAWHRHIKYLFTRPENDDYTVIFLDEMFCVWSNTGYSYDLWTMIGKRHYLKWNGSRKKTCVYGALAEDGRQLFRLYDKFNSEQFIKFLQQIHEKFGKIMIIMDKAAPHKSKMVEQYVLDNPGIRIEYLPTGCPEYNPIEACWYMTKKKICRSTYYETFDDMCDELSEYLRTHKFTNIRPFRYLFRKPLEIQNF